MTLWLTTYLPNVSVGDIIVTPLGPSLECHVLFKLSLMSIFFSFSIVILELEKVLNC